MSEEESQQDGEEEEDEDTQNVADQIVPMNNSPQKSSKNGDKVAETEETESEEDEVFPDVIGNDEESRKKKADQFDKYLKSNGLPVAF